MEAQRAEILNRLSAHGWSVRCVDDYELEWWADEMWLLESTWSPAGGRAWVTFLVDPQTSDVANRRKGKGVWALLASPEKPTRWQASEGEFSLGLGRGWEDELPALLEYLDAVRAGSRQDA
ncbi:MAG TPA: hypothetical protein VF240_08975 [Pyrinomonadaceae bacterium]